MQVKIAGTKGTVTIDPAEGVTARELLVQVAREFKLSKPEETVDRLTPVVDGRTSELDAPVPAHAERLTAAPQVRNG